MVRVGRLVTSLPLQRLMRRASSTLSSVIAINRRHHHQPSGVTSLVGRHVTTTGVRHQTAMGAGHQVVDHPWTAMVVVVHEGRLGTMGTGVVVTGETGWIGTGRRRGITTGVEIGGTGTETGAVTGAIGTSGRGTCRQAAGEIVCGWLWASAGCA